MKLLAFIIIGCSIGTIFTLLYILAKTILEYTFLKKLKRLEAKQLELKPSETSSVFYVEDGIIKEDKIKNISFYKRLRNEL